MTGAQQIKSLGRQELDKYTVVFSKWHSEFRVVREGEIRR